MWEVTNGNALSYAKDGRGNVTGLVGATGYQVKYRYDAFGNRKTFLPDPQHPETWVEGTYGSHSSSIGYRGQLHDASTNQIYLRNRYYEPDLGRFQQMDPARKDGNFYNYCGSDPVNKWDPMGLDWTFRKVRNKDGKLVVGYTWIGSPEGDTIPQAPPKEVLLKAQRYFNNNPDADTWTYFEESRLAGYSVNKAGIIEEGKLKQVKPIGAVRQDGMWKVAPIVDGNISVDETKLREATLDEYMLIYLDKYAAAKLMLKKQSTLLTNITTAFKLGEDESSTIAIMAYFAQTPAGRELVKKHGPKIVGAVIAVYAGYKIGKKFGVGGRVKNFAKDLIARAVKRLKGKADDAAEKIVGASDDVLKLLKQGQKGRAADKHYEDMVRAKVKGVAKDVAGREYDCITDTAIIQVKRSISAFDKPKNFLNKATRAQIKATIDLAKKEGKRAEFWFKYGADSSVVKYIQSKGGTVIFGLGD